MFSTIGVFDNAKNFTASIDMLNRDAQPSQCPIVRLFVRGQFASPGLFDRGEPLAPEFGKPLIPRIAIFFNRRGDAQAGLFQKLEIMDSTLPADDDENLETEQTDDQLRFDGVPFFFPEYQARCCRIGRSMGCSVTSTRIAPIPRSNRADFPGT